MSTFQFDYGEIRRVDIVTNTSLAHAFQFDYGEIRSELRTFALKWLWRFQFDYGEIRRLEIGALQVVRELFQFDYGEIRSGSVLKPLVVPIRLWWTQKRYNREVLGGLFSRSNSTMVKSEAIKILPNLRILLRVPIRLWWNQKFESGIRSIVNRRVPIRLWWNQKCHIQQAVCLRMNNRFNSTMMTSEAFACEVLSVTGTSSNSTMMKSED